MIRPLPAETNLTSASYVSCKRDTARICCWVPCCDCWWCMQGTQPQTRCTSELRLHDGTDRRTDAKSCAPYRPIIWAVVAIIEETPVDTISTIFVLHSSSCQCTLRDVTTLYPPLPLTSHIVTSAWISLPFRVCQHLWTSPRQWITWKDQ